MNTWKTTQSLLMLIVLLALATAAGCAATPEDRWFQQRDALNTANRIYLANVPQMTDEQIVHYGELLQTAREQLNEAEAQLPEGGSSFDTMLDMVESILARVIALDPGSAAPETDTPAPTVPSLATPDTEDTPDDTR